MTSGVIPDSEEVIKQAYPTTVGGLANLDFPGLNIFLAKNNEDKVSPPAKVPAVMCIRIRWISIMGGWLDPDPHGEKRIRIQYILMCRTRMWQKSYLIKLIMLTFHKF